MEVLPVGMFVVFEGLAVGVLLRALIGRVPQSGPHCKECNGDCSAKGRIVCPECGSDLLDVGVTGTDFSKEDPPSPFCGQCNYDVSGISDFACDHCRANMLTRGIVGRRQFDIDCESIVFYGTMAWMFLWFSIVVGVGAAMSTSPAATRDGTYSFLGVLTICGWIVGCLGLRYVWKRRIRAHVAVRRGP